MKLPSSWTGEGAGFVGLNLEGAGKSNGCSDYSVVCEITANNADPTGIDRAPGGVTITAVHLYERK